VCRPVTIISKCRQIAWSPGSYPISCRLVWRLPSRQGASCLLNNRWAHMGRSRFHRCLLYNQAYAVSFRPSHSSRPCRAHQKRRQEIHRDHEAARGQRRRPRRHPWKTTKLSNWRTTSTKSSLSTHRRPPHGDCRKTEAARPTTAGQSPRLGASPLGACQLR